MIRLNRMDCLNAIKLVAVLSFVHATSGQTAVASGPPSVAAATNVLLTCTVNGGSASTIQWIDVTGGATVIIYGGEDRFSLEPKYDNFDVTTFTATQSVMTIESAEVEDDGEYRCLIPTDSNGNIITLVIEAPSNVTVTLTSIVTNNEDMYVATCDAIGGKPRETLTWTLNGVDQSDGNGNTIDETYPPATAPLSNSKSVFTFPATRENHGQTLVCQVSGHDIEELNVPTSTDLDIHDAPGADIMTVEIQSLNPNYTVLCNISEAAQPNPRIRNYYIYSDSTLIHQSSTGVNFVNVPESEYDLSIVFNCVAENYLGRTTTYPPSTTSPTPTATAALETTTLRGVGSNGSQTGSPATEPSTTSIITTGMPGEDSTEPSANVAAIAGGVVAAIVIIVIIVIAVCYCKKQERFCFEAGGTPAPSNKPSGRAVGSSNGSGSEKEKLPQAAPRGHGSIQHTNDNPDQAMYAMVDKKPARGGGGGAGDAPDRGSAPGQNEPPGMLYADLDLSHKAGHTDKHVPKNENDVVVYSSILV